MGFAGYYVNICEAFGCGGHIYCFQTNCRDGPRLMYYLKHISFSEAINYRSQELVKTQSASLAQHE